MLQYDLAGNFIAEFPSYEAAAKVVNCSRSGISKAANNSIITLKGYYWKNKNDTIDIKEKIQKLNLNNILELKKFYIPINIIIKD